MKTKLTTKQKTANSIKANVINRFLDDLENKELKECEQARKYISRFGFAEVEKYLEGREDCLKQLIECNYTHPKTVL